MLLYIHIPFCDSKCFYCSFNSYTNLFKYKDWYFKSLLKQLQHDLNKFRVTNIKTVFIGGGTPSSIDSKYYKDIFKILKRYKIQEITVEANPNSATFDWQKEMFDFGVNRISFGIQSFDEKKLKYLGRAHDKYQAIKAIKDSYKVGFKNINCDIIYDTILDNIDLINNDLNIIKILPINHISCYSLTIEDNTNFSKTKQKTKTNLKITQFLFDRLKKLQFNQYEISNFAKNEAISLHNFGYWELKNYLGIGSGAVGFIDDFRYYPNSDVLNYIKNPLYKKIEKLTKQDLKFEKIFLGLRSKVGVNIDIFSKKEIKKVDILLKDKKLIKIDNKIYNKDYLLADEIALFLSNDK